MQQTIRKLPLIAVLLLAGCSTAPSNYDVATGPVLTGPTPAATEPVAITPASTPIVVETPNTATGDAAAFLDGTAFAALSARDKAEAASAQFNALTFGRPGAPRTWTGDKGVTGSVTVGPYVRVNNIDCRDFTHTVTVNGTAYPKKGTACREADGSWSVAG